jgi:hypothetical protein
LPIGVGNHPEAYNQTGKLRLLLSQLAALWSNKVHGIEMAQLHHGAALTGTAALRMH